LRGWLQKSKKKFEQAFNLKKNVREENLKQNLQFLDPYLELLDIKHEEYIECRDNPDDHPLFHYAKLPNL
jgi:sensor histidine kinase YesM